MEKARSEHQSTTNKIQIGLVEKNMITHTFCPIPQTVTAYAPDLFVQWIFSNFRGVGGGSPLLRIGNVGVFKVEQHVTPEPIRHLCIGVDTLWVSKGLIAEMLAAGCIELSREKGAITFAVQVEDCTVGEIILVPRTVK